MKKIFRTLPLLLGIILVCCSSDDTAVPTADIAVRPDPVTAAAEGERVSLTVVSDREWGVYATESWITCSPTGGLAGTSTVTLDIQSNPSQLNDRTARIVFRSGETRHEVEVTQRRRIVELRVADERLRAHLAARYDTDGDGIFSEAEASALTELDVSGLGIASFDELPVFAALERLDCSENSLTTIDLRALTRLERLDCSNNRLTELDITANRSLRELDCTGNPIALIRVPAGFTAPDGFHIPDGARYVAPDLFVPEGYALLWSDEFDGSQLDTSCWTAETGTGSGGWGNAELQYYTDRRENLRVENGNLVITAIRENYQGAPATSARLITLGKVAFKYGYVVASIRLPKTADGLWPAFWMMGNDFREVGWPRCGETDILEMGHADGIKAGTQERYLNGACHWGRSYANHVTYDYPVQDGEYHTFTCIWDEEYIRMYIDLESHPDARPYFEMRITDDMGNEVFRKDNFLLLNLAVGGNFPGIHDIAGVTALAGGSASMYVDYVRVFQKK